MLRCGSHGQRLSDRGLYGQAVSDRGFLDPGRGGARLFIFFRAAKGVSNSPLLRLDTGGEKVQGRVLNPEGV